MTYTKASGCEAYAQVLPPQSRITNRPMGDLCFAFLRERVYYTRKEKFILLSSQKGSKRDYHETDYCAHRFRSDQKDLQNLSEGHIDHQTEESQKSNQGEVEETVKEDVRIPHNRLPDSTGYEQQVHQKQKNCNRQEIQQSVQKDQET